MRMLNFAKRNFKELIRDPLSLIFQIALPLLLLLIFQQFNIPSESYNIENFTPGIIVFGFSFITLFTASLVAKDRTSSFLIHVVAIFLSLVFLLRLEVKEGCNGNGWVLGIVYVYLAIKFLVPLKTAFTELDLHSFC